MIGLAQRMSHTGSVEILLTRRQPEVLAIFPRKSISCRTVEMEVMEMRLSLNIDTSAEAKMRGITPNCFVIRCGLEFSWWYMCVLLSPECSTFLLARIRSKFEGSVKTEIDNASTHEATSRYQGGGCDCEYPMKPTIDENIVQRDIPLLTKPARLPEVRIHARTTRMQMLIYYH
jgi:hypothetical protein